MGGRQFAAHVLVDAAEDGHDFDEKENGDADGHNGDDGRVHHGGFYLLAEALRVLLIGGEAGKNFGEQTALFAGRDHRVIEAGENLGMFLQRLGEAIAGFDARGDIFDQVAHDLVLGLFGESLEGLDHGQAGVDHGGQLAGEHHKVSQRNRAAAGAAFLGDLFLNGDDEKVAVEQGGDGAGFGGGFDGAPNFAAGGRIARSVSERRHGGFSRSVNSKFAATGQAQIVMPVKGAGRKNGRRVDKPAARLQRKSKSSMSIPTRFTLAQKDIPHRWYNLLADFPEPLPPPLHPGTREPVTPDLMLRLFPQSLVEQEMAAAKWIEIPAEVREVYALWRPTPLLRAVRLERGAANSGPYLLQIRGRQPGRKPQGEHLRSASLLQQNGRHKTPGDRNRRRPMGIVPGHGVSNIRLGVCRLHGARELRAEALPADVDAHLGRDRVSESERSNGLWPRLARVGPGLRRQPRHRDQRGGRGHRHASRHQVRPGQRVEPRLPAPDRDWPGSDPANGTGGRRAGRRRGLRWRRQQFRGAGLPVSGREKSGAAGKFG